MADFPGYLADDSRHIHPRQEIIAGGAGLG